MTNDKIAYLQIESSRSLKNGKRKRKGYGATVANAKRNKSRIRKGK